MIHADKSSVISKEVRPVGRRLTSRDRSRVTWKLGGALLIASQFASVGGGAAEPIAEWRGVDFAGGAKAQVGSAFYGRDGVNVVYSRSVGAAATMSASVVLDRVPEVPVFLSIEAMDDDAPAPCAARIALNGREVVAEPSGFPNARWKIRRFALPSEALTTGTNQLEILNLEPSGTIGSPPWFMVARAAIGDASYTMARIEPRRYQVRLPEQARPFPEPLRSGEQPGFRFRGTKGWAWTPEQYLAEIPYLEKFKMNFLMNCYISMFDVEHHVWTDGDANRWWEDMPNEKRQAYERVVRACQQHGVQFCFSMNPNLHSKRLVNDGSLESVDQLYKHYAWMQSLGVKWFNISLDDASQGINPSTQARVVNEILKRLRAKDPEAQMIFCPTFYWGDGTATNQMNWGLDQQPYLETLARELHKDVYLFWTGDDVLGRITRRGAESFRRLSGHRLFLWDNYPVNDDQPTMHLGPVIKRDADLCRVVDGYMSNPMCKQNEINRLPLSTCADYAYNPAAYDPDRSIGQAILLLAKNSGQRRALKELVELYPGFLLTGGGTGTNPLREWFRQLSQEEDSAAGAQGLLRQVTDLAAKLDNEFPRELKAAKATLNSDITWMKGQR